MARLSLNTENDRSLGLNYEATGAQNQWYVSGAATGEFSYGAGIGPFGGSVEYDPMQNELTFGGAAFFLGKGDASLFEVKGTLPFLGGKGDASLFRSFIITFALSILGSRRCGNDS